MANYKVVDADKLDADLTSVADKIRNSCGSVGKMVFPDGYKKGIDDVYSFAYESGNSTGYFTGHEEGYSIGYSEGNQAGYNDGYDDGYEEGTKSSIPEDLDSVLTEQEALIDELKTALQGKASGGESIDGIPDGYGRVDYIQFNGTQTIDTGIICNQNTKIQLAFTRERSTQHYMFGVASSDNKASVTAYMGGSWRFGNKSVSKVPTTNADMIYSGLVDKSTVTITGSASAISSVNDFETIGSLLLGACRNSNGTVGSSQFEGKIFFFSMWEGVEQVLKLVPVTDGNAYRFFDIVSKTFFDSITDTPLGGGNL